MKRIIAFALCSLTLSACASYIWNKVGASQQDFQRDSYECEKDMRQSGYYGRGLIGALTGTTPQAFEERCMAAKGWTKIER